MAQQSVDLPEILLRVTRSGPLRGVCRVPGDKSISHRALLFGALADGPVEIDGLGLGGDNVSTARALAAMGVPMELDGAHARVVGVGFAGLRQAPGALDCGNSGTSIRLLLGLLAGRSFESRLEGDASLSRRPMNRVAKPLRQMGATIAGRQDSERPDDIFPPVLIQGGALHGVTYALPVASAQIKSALILAGLQADGSTRLTEPGLSRDHSERMLRFMGAPLSADVGRRTVTIDPSGWNGRLRAGPLRVPGDLSSAAFLMVAASLVPGSDITIEGVGLNPTRTGIVDGLLAMGADLEVEVTADVMGEPIGRVRVRARRLHGARIAGEQALRALDEIPALAVAAAMADGRSEFADLGELRVKESDRIASIARELGRAGVRVEESSEGFVIDGQGGRPPRGGRVRPDHDHRIAMAGAILGLCGDDDTLVPSSDIATSFPSFADTLSALGASVS